MDVREVLERAGPRAAASHQSAARLWGIELLHPGPERITVPRQRSRLKVPGWGVRRLDLPADDVLVVDGLRRTTPERTVLDLARVLPLAEAVVASDSALRRQLVQPVALRTRLATCRGAGAAAPRAVAPLLDPLAGSVLESLLRVLLVLAGHPPPASQFLVCERDGELVARVDLCWPALRLVVEADGFAFHSDRRAYRADRARLNALERLGWRVLRFTWEDVTSRPEHVVATVRACLVPQAA